MSGPGRELPDWTWALEPVPPPPPFARIEEAIDARVRTGRPILGWPLAAAVAAVLLLAVVWVWRDDAPSRRPALSGSGLGGFILGEGVQVRSREGAHVVAALPSEVRWADGAIRMVLDGRSGATLAQDGARLDESSRAWFEVEPRSASIPPFVVQTPRGDVRVVGTRFEVDLRGADLGVTVTAGLVEVRTATTPSAQAGQVTQVSAGKQYRAGQLGDLEGSPGGWFRSPTLRVAGPESLSRESPPPLVLVFGNPGNVPIEVEARDGAPASLWIAWRAPDGLVREIVARGDAWPPAGGSLALPARAEQRVPVGFLPPLSPPGTYRVSALYRPADGPSVRSGEVSVEVR